MVDVEVDGLRKNIILGLISLHDLNLLILLVSTLILFLLDDKCL